MKFFKSGKPKFGTGDFRVGSNFCLHVEKGHFKVEPVSGWFSLRIPRYSPVGAMIETALRNRVDGGKDGDRFLENYCAVLMNILSVVPDIEFMEAVNGAAVASVERHKDLYGVKDDVSEEEDAKVLQEERELAEAEEAARKEEGL